jgi:hypothetical protein
MWGSSACGVLDFDIETEVPGGVKQGEGTNSADVKDDGLTMKETPIPSAEPSATPVEEPEYSFEPIAYHDDESGFELLYPTSWTTPGGQVIGTRGYNVAFFEGDEVRMGATVYLWDPKRDLQAWSEQRELAWTSSGGQIVSKEEVILQGDQTALAYVIESVVGEEAFFLLTTIGDRYFELAGDVDLELLQEISTTVRIPEFEPPPPIVDDLDCRFVTKESSLEWVACNIRDGLVSRNLAALPSYMRDTFALGYWQSEWTEVTPEYMINDLEMYRLPSDLSSPLAFTTDREQFPPLFGISPDRMLAPEINLAMVIYSEGWGEIGKDAAILFIVEDSEGEFYWYGMLIAGGHFDK